MTNLLKLSTLAGICFAIIVFGACGGGKGGGSGGYTVTVNGTAYSGTASGTVNARWTVTNGYTYYQTGTDTEWHIQTNTVSGTATGTHTN